MQIHVIGSKEAGQRMDKFLHKFMPEATTSFFYKMLRKKNITLNGKKAEGKEILKEGDQIAFFFSDETFQKFKGQNGESEISTNEYRKAFQALKGIQVIYEDEDILILNKPAGILSQKAKPEDMSLNEWLIGYLLHTNGISKQELVTFKPSICNRLDRNTSGLVLGGKTLKGSQELSKMIRERSLRKFYLTVVVGPMDKASQIDGYLWKDEKTNKVTIYPKKAVDLPKGADAIKTAYKPLKTIGTNTLLEVELITGKTHQIRAHLASIGHPVLGDEKYGNTTVNQQFQKTMGLRWQILHAYRLEFPIIEEGLTSLSEQVFVAEEPTILKKIQQG